MLSDHFLVNINVSLQKQSVSTKVISYRRYKSIDKVSKILVKNIIASAKSEYYNKKIKHPRTVFSVVNKLLHKSQTVLPNNINSDKDIAHCFNNFLNIHSGFRSSTLSQGKPLVDESCISMMDTCKPFTETDIRQLLKRSSNTFCAVDPMPTWLVKDCLDVLINPNTNILNKPLSLGVFQDL